VRSVVSSPIVSDEAAGRFRPQERGRKTVIHEVAHHFGISDPGLKSWLGVTRVTTGTERAETGAGARARAKRAGPLQEGRRGTSKRSGGEAARTWGLLLFPVCVTGAQVNGRSCSVACVQAVLPGRRWGPQG
jgi:hypothetical protein